MDAGNLLDKVSDNLSVRRAFGAAYEKDGTLIIPSRWWPTAAVRARPAPARLPGPVIGPKGMARHRGIQRQAAGSVGWCCRPASTS